MSWCRLSKGVMRVERGELARAVMDCLWESPDGLVAAGVVERLEVRTGRRLAVTTVLTVLERLRHKGLVDRVRDGRGYRYHAGADREALVVEAMAVALADSADRTLALAKFVDAITPEEQAVLRSLLSGESSAAGETETGEGSEGSGR